MKSPISNDEHDDEPGRDRFNVVLPPRPVNLFIVLLILIMGLARFFWEDDDDSYIILCSAFVAKVSGWKIIFDSFNYCV